MKSLLLNSAISLSLALFLTSCGGGGRNSNSNSNNNNNNSKPPLNQNLTSNATFDRYGNACNLTIVNSFKLPPCPNPEINDNTLLGIDQNKNEVRDDVERWLIMKYKDHHPIVTEIGFQGARAHQFMLEYPDRWRESYKMISAALHCNFYFEFDAKFRNEPILIDHGIATEKKLFRSVQHNTEARIRGYLSYDQKLSGGVYTLPDIDEERVRCDFDVDRYLREYPVDNDTDGNKP